MEMREILSGSALCCLVLLASTAAAQYAPGDTVVTDQNTVGPAGLWPLWGITPQGKLYTVTTQLPLYAWSIAPAPDNRSLWVSGKGINGYTTSTVAPDGTLTHLNIDFRNLFSCIDVDGGGNVILGNMVNPDIVKYAGKTFTTLYTGAPLSNVQGGGIDLFTGDLVLVQSSGIYQANLTGQTRISTVLTSIPAVRNGGGLHDDPETATLVGSWGTGLYRLALGSPGILTTLKTGFPLGNVGALDRDPFDGQYVVPSMGNMPGASAMVFRFDAKNAALTTLYKFPIPPAMSVSPLAATVAGSRHLCAGNEARPGQALTLMVSSPNEPGAAYIVAASFGFGPGIPLGQGRKVFLSPDALFYYSLQNTGIFSGFQGLIGPKGEAIASLRIPNLPQLSGLRFFAAAVTINQNQISVISDTLGVTIH